MKLNKNFFNHSRAFSITPFLLFLTVGCGGAPQVNNFYVTAAEPNDASATTAQTSPSNTLNNLTPPNLNGAYNFGFELQNSVIGCNNGQNPTPEGVAVGHFTTSAISTDNVFKVTVTAGAPSILPCTWGSTANYSCLQFKVTVGSESKIATVSYGTPKQDSPCHILGATSSATLDFSDQASEGHGALAVTVSQPKSDNCRLSDGIEFAGCAMTTLYGNQIASGNLAVITNHQ